MGDLLSIIAIVGLVALVVVSVTRQRAAMTQTKADEDHVPRELTSSAIDPWPPRRGKSGAARPGRLTAGSVSSPRAASRP